MTFNAGESLLSQWMRHLLDCHSLLVPDGRPLYAYRLTEEQYATLQTTLRSKLDGYPNSGTLGLIVNSNPLFCALFVLYASEWWRRRYDGSKWSWEPIQRDIGAQAESWAATQRGECIERGLREWKLNLSETSGLRYLGSVAVQGGLPMQLLAIARGNIGRVLRRVLGLARGSTAGFREIRGWIESLKDELPKSYQREEIYILLTDVITTVLSLRKDANLTKSTNAIAQLDQRIPSWRERFPLPVEDSEVQGLIEQLIRDVADDSGKPSGCSLKVERSLESQGDEIWRLCSSIALPETLASQAICTLFGIADSNDIPRTVEFVIEVSDHRLSINARRLAGHDCYRLDRRPCQFTGQVAMEEYRLTLRATDGRSWSAALSSGEPLDRDLPWIFEQTQENSPRLIRQGGGSVQTVEALVAIPNGWKMVMGTETPCLLKAFIEEPDREVYEVKGEVIITDTLGHRWTIRTGQANASEESFQWSGDRVWAEFLRPALAFRGRPALRMIRSETSQFPVSEHSLSRVPKDVAAGPVEVTYTERQELRHRARMVLLPKEATVDLEPENLSRGTIYLRHWKAAGAHLLENSGIDMRTNRDGDSMALICSSHDATPPEWIEIEVVWDGNVTPARIRLPFPSEGARAFDCNGAELPADAWLSAQRLAGIRLVTISRHHVPVELFFCLRHTKDRQNAHEARHRIRPVAGSLRIDIRLQDYVDDIERLLAADELLDAWVEVTLSLNHKETLRIRVSRYVCPMQRDGNNVSLKIQEMKQTSLEALGELSVFALRLDQPGEDAIALLAKLSEGVPTGAWEFAAESREPGSWLIYPGADSALPFRPTLWIVPGETSATSPLTRALAIENRDERAAALSQVIEAMAADFCDPSWADLERLVKHLGHLPLAALDLWRRLVHSPVGMAALGLRLHNLPDGFLRRFPLEQPFIWEMVSIKEWIAAADQLKQQCASWFGEEIAQQRLGDFLTERVIELTRHQPTLRNLLGIIRSVILQDGCREIRMMRDPGSDKHFQQRLFVGEQSALQRLLRDHADETWPSDSGLFAWVNDARQHGSFAHLFPKESLTFRDGVIGLPILLAIQVATNVTGEWFNHPERIHILRTYQAFDPDWFTEAFDLTIARCLSAGVMQL